MTAGKGRPADLTFNTAYYARAGMCQITSKGAVQDSEAASKAFDGDSRTGWRDRGRIQLDSVPVCGWQEIPCHLVCGGLPGRAAPAESP